ncbi:MAG: beta strand repeat-containing protein [Bacilli bacterium]
MKKLIKWLFPILGVTSCFALMVSVFSNGGNKYISTTKNNTSSPEYTINFTDKENHVETSGTGTVTAKTVMGNEIEFAYTDATSTSDSFVILASGGSFYNNYSVSVVGNNRLSGVYSVTATFSGTLNLDYTWNETLESGEPYLRSGIVLQTGVEFTFGNETPSFLKFSAGTAVTIESINVKYSCSYSDIPDSVYKISNPNDLVNFTYLVNNGLQDLSAILLDDINMDGVSYSGIDTTYTGTFNGNNHAITGLSFSTGGVKCNDSLFAILGDGGVIQNLDVTATLTNVDTRNAIIVGEMTGASTIKNCIARGTVTAKATADEGIGGVVGYISSTTGAVVDNCVNFASVTSPSNGSFGRRVAGIVGGTGSSSSSAPTKATITNCTNYGKIYARSYAGGIVGQLGYGTTQVVDGNKNYGIIDTVNGGYGGGIVGRFLQGTITNNFSGGGYVYGTTTRITVGHKTTTTTDEDGNSTTTTTYLKMDDISIIAKKVPTTVNYLASASDKSVAGYETIGSGSTNYGYCVGEFNGTGVIDDTNIAGWSGSKTAASALSGTGTEEDPYLIVRAKDYFALRDICNASSSDVHFKLMKDIDLDYHKDDPDYSASTNTAYSLIIGTAAAKTEALAFKGTFDGNGHTIYNFSSSTGDTIGSGLFSYTDGATIKNVTFVNPTIKNVKSKGMIAVVTGSTTGVTIEKVNVVGGRVNSTNEVGSLVGTVKSGTATITNCSSSATITGTNSVGGFVGGVGFTNNSTSTTAATLDIQNSTFTGTITTSAASSSTFTGVGGIVGASGTIDSITIDGCVNVGSVTDEYNEGVGGIFGKNVEIETTSAITISDCKNYGAIAGVDSVGGIVGHASETTNTSIVSNSNNYGNIAGSDTSTAVGGIFGTKNWAAESCNTSKTATVISGTYKAETVFGETTVYLAGVDNKTESNTDCGLCNPETYVAPSKLIKNTVTTVSAHLAHYGRYAELNNGKNIFTYSGGYFLSTTDGFTYGSFTSFKTLETEYVPIYNGNSSYVLTIANLEPLVLPDGRLVIFYRSMLKDVYSSIRARISTDNGVTFSSPIIILENYGSLGMYEPFGVIDDNTIQLFISCDISSTLDGGYGPDNTSLICKNGYQNIVRIPIDISTKSTFNIGDPTPVIKGTTNYRRPGMSVVSQLLDGSYAMVIEHNGTLSSTSNYKMRIAISYSKDLLTWTTPKDLILPSQSGEKVINGVADIYRAQAPYIQVLPSGQIAVSYMTNEFYEGDYFETDNDIFRTVELSVSTKRVNYNDTVEMERVEFAGHHEYNHGSSFGSCKIIKGELVLIYTDYEITDESFNRTSEGFSFSRITIL